MKWRDVFRKKVQNHQLQGGVNKDQTQAADAGLMPIEMRAGVGEDTTMGPYNCREDVAVVGALVACPVDADINKAQGDIEDQSAESNNTGTGMVMTRSQSSELEQRQKQDEVSQGMREQREQEQ